MGKIKRTKRNHGDSLNNPTGLPSVKDTECEITMEEQMNMETVIEKLNSVDADDREYGCTALSIYVTSQQTLQKLFDKNIVRLVTPLLQDFKPAVQVAASVTLRAMSEEGGFDACEQMIRQDVITGLADNLTKCVSSQTSMEDGAVDKRPHSFINCIYTVQSLCECSALAVRMCIEDSVPQVLIDCLKSERSSSAVLLAAAQCLYTMSEENESVIDVIKLPPSQEIIQSLITNEKVSLYARVVLVGVQLNAHGTDVLTGSGGKSLSALLQALQVDIYSQLCLVVSSCVNPDCQNGAKPEQDVQMEDDGSDGKKANLTDLRKELKSVDDLISAQKLAFEIFTNILGGDDTDEWDDMDDDDSSCGTASDVHEYMEDEDIDMEAQSPIATTLVEKGLVKLLGQRLQFISVEVYESVEAVDKTYRQLLQSTMHGYDSLLSSALLCLNNLTSHVKADKFGGVESLRSMLHLLLASLSLTQVSCQESLVESITGALRSITELITKQSQEVIFDEKEMNTLGELTRVSHTATAVHAVRCVTAVGVSLSKQSAPHPAVKAIGGLLIETATSSKELWLVAESLDAIMDVFAEDTNNTFLKELGIISTLSTIVPQLKAMVAKRDKSNDHFLPVLTTVKSNLPRFIKYKNKMI